MRYAILIAVVIICGYAGRRYGLAQSQYQGSDAHYQRVDRAVPRPAVYHAEPDGAVASPCPPGDYLLTYWTNPAEAGNDALASHQCLSKLRAY